MEYEIDITSLICPAWTVVIVKIFTAAGWNVHVLDLKLFCSNLHMLNMAVRHKLIGFAEMALQMIVFASCVKALFVNTVMTYILQENT